MIQTDRTVGPHCRPSGRWILFLLLGFFLAGFLPAIPPCLWDYEDARGGASNRIRIGDRPAKNVKRPPEWSRIRKSIGHRARPAGVAPYGSSSEQMLPASNRLNILVVPVSYSDTNLIISSNELDQLFNGPAYSSCSNYYAVQSAGKLALHFTILSPITLPQGRSVYSASYDDYNTNFVWKALIQVTNQMSGWSSSAIQSQFDANQDGFLDGIMFLHAGEGGETSGNAADIHSYQFSLYFEGTEGVGLGSSASSIQVGGLYVGRYIITPEVQNRRATQVFQRSTIGTHVHEFGHMLGLVDLYNTDDGTDTVLLDCELMSGGSYNYLPTQYESYPFNGTNYVVLGKYPAPLGAYHRRLLGWLTPDELYVSSRAQYALTNLTGSTGSPGPAVKVRGVSPSEYWYLENRYYGISAATNFDRGLYGQGLLIWRVNESVIGPRVDTHYFSTTGINNDPSLRGLDLDAFDPISYSNTGYAMYAFWTNQRGGFSPNSTPSSAYRNTKSQSGVTVSNISGAASVMTFDFRALNTEAFLTNTLVAYPSPFVPASSGSLNSSGTGILSLSVVQPQKIKGFLIQTTDGRSVRDLTSSLGSPIHQDGGKWQYLLSWDGKDRKGSYVGAGIYWVRVVLEDGSIHLAGRFYVHH